MEDPAQHVNGWIFWPWKRIPEAGWAAARFQDLMEIRSTKDWDTVRKFLGSIFGLKEIPRDVALRGLADFLEASQVEKLVANPEMLEVLQNGQLAVRKSAVPQREVQ
ncbi:MAG: hypothetical protein K8J08_03865 [Thermoanaerobaculia bacterium]|nr:hypothetical protein [Thermoanaerobaculia bacterium]